MERFTTLEKALKTAWNLVYRAAVSRNAPMRTPVLATIADGHPHQRTIVLRKVDTNTHLLYFFSDMRAPKVMHLQQNPNCNLVFWDPRKKVQIEIQAKGKVFHQATINEEFWNQINIGGRTSYAALHAPGTPIKKDQAYLPDNWSKEMDIQDTQYTFEHFSVLALDVQQLDVLHLHEAGHQRCLFTKTEEMNWKMSWLVP